MSIVLSLCEGSVELNKTGVMILTSLSLDGMAFNVGREQSMNTELLADVNGERGILGSTVDINVNVY